MKSVYKIGGMPFNLEALSVNLSTAFGLQSNFELKRLCIDSRIAD